MSGIRHFPIAGSALLSDLAVAARTYARIATGRKPRFTGAFTTREAALGSLPVSERHGYDQDEVADISYDGMSRVAPWDYPALYWMARCLQDTDTFSVLDAGGHLGTKYTAFSSYLPIERIRWLVWDLPAILRAGRNWQAKGRLPNALSFADTPASAGPVDMLLASGLMQYFDRSLQQLLDEMAAAPRWILLNKVALRSGGTIVTLEQIGPARVPYQIRDEATWAAELDQLDYRIIDRWEIPSLGHRIGTHPWLGESRSAGCLLERK